MANVSSQDLNPIRFASAAHYIVVAGTKSPGAIAVDGIRGFDRETGWDKKKGKGSKGATLTLETQPPSEGEIAIQLWLPEHFPAWDEFVKLFKYNPAKNPKTGADAVDIFHPAFVAIGLVQVVAKKISPWRHVGKGLYIVTLELIEWQPPPPVSIVATTNSAKTGNADASPGGTPDPIADAQQKLIGQLLQDAAKP